MTSFSILECINIEEPKYYCGNCERRILSDQILQEKTRHSDIMQSFWRVNFKKDKYSTPQLDAVMGLIIFGHLLRPMSIRLHLPLRRLLKGSSIYSCGQVSYRNTCCDKERFWFRRKKSAVEVKLCPFRVLTFRSATNIWSNVCFNQLKSVLSQIKTKTYCRQKIHLLGF